MYKKAKIKNDEKGGRGAGLEHASKSTMRKAELASRNPWEIHQLYILESTRNHRRIPTVRRYILYET